MTSFASFKFENVPEKRSKTMKAIRSTGNQSTERRFRLALVRAGIKGWKLQPSGLPGKPDFYFPKQNVVVFVDGCFWHGCIDCKMGHTPKTNQVYWSPKIQRNKDRDKVILVNIEES